MAWTEARKNGFIGRYRVDGRTHSTPLFRRKSVALKEAEQREQDGKRGDHFDQRSSKITLNEWFAIWCAGRKGKAARTQETEQERFRTLIAPTFGTSQLRAIKYEDVALWSDNMKDRKGTVASQARRRDAVRLLTQVLDAAVDAGRLRENPARSRSGKNSHLPKQSRSKPHRYLSHEQLRRLADATATAQSRALILTAGLTGLRWGELSALTVADVDLLRARLRVTKAYTTLDRGDLLLGDTKTHATREVPIHSVAAMLEPIMAGKRPSDLLFSTRDGKPLRRESFTRSVLEPANGAAGNAVSELQRLLGMEANTVSGVYDGTTAELVRGAQIVHGLPATGVCDRETWDVLTQADRARRDGMTQGEKVKRTNLLKKLSRLTLSAGATDFERITLHDLRHTAASLAIASGANVKAVQRLLGHESAHMTLNIYAGLFENDLDDLGRALSPAHAAHHVPTAQEPFLAGVTPMHTSEAL